MTTVTTSSPRQLRFPTLGTTACLTVRDHRDLATAAALARRVLADVDEVCSRFRSDSDLSRVNTRPGHWVAVDPLLVAALELALAAAEQTAGLVNPLLGRPMVQLGYDCDFTQLRWRDRTATPLDPLPPDENAWRDVEVDPDGAVRIPAGTALDLGCTAKSWASDLIAAACEGALRAGALIGLGGDLMVVGVDRWPVCVSERPDDPPDAWIAIDRGGLATSSTQVRRWSSHGVRRHHLLDPRTGQPVHEVWRTVTATGPTCAAANVAATAAVVLGNAAPGWLACRSVAARLVGRDGEVRVVGGWPSERRAA